MAKNKIKKQAVGRISLKDKLMHRLWCKDQQIAALLRGRDMRNHEIKKLIKQNEMAMRMITSMLKYTGGICVLRAEDIAGADIDSIGIYEDTEGQAIYLGHVEKLKAIMLRQSSGSMPLPDASKDDQSGVEDVLDTVKADKDPGSYDGDHIDTEAIDDQETKDLVDNLRRGC